MYEADDVRAGMGKSGQQSGKASSAGATGAVSSRFGASSYGRFYAEEAQEDGADQRNWYTGGQNFVVCYSEVAAGSRFERSDQPDEYVLLLYDKGMTATVEANGETQAIAGGTITMIPPGTSAITCHADGRIVRLITTQSADITAKASNGDAYTPSNPHIPAFEPWPAPPTGWKIRSYSLDVPAQEGRFGRIFRCTSFMVNVFEPQGPRDITKLSPHHHDDFEQGSLALEGWYMHHLRWPWTANQNDWRDDEHERCDTPSVCIIPPGVIHTSAPSDPRSNVLVDIFAPPREDFSAMPGWVLNAADYPQAE